MTQPERNRSRSTEAADIARRRFLPQAARSLGTFRYLCVRAGHSSGLAERETAKLYSTGVYSCSPMSRKPLGLM
jgi:hypothetical protein